MKRFLNSVVSLKWMDWEFGQGCQAKGSSVNGITVLNSLDSSFESYLTSLLSEYLTLSAFLLGLSPKTQSR